MDNGDKIIAKFTEIVDAVGELREEIKRVVMTNDGMGEKMWCVASDTKYTYALGEDVAAAVKAASKAMNMGDKIKVTETRWMNGVMVFVGAPYEVIVEATNEDNKG